MTVAAALAPLLSRCCKNCDLQDNDSLLVSKSIKIGRFTGLGSCYLFQRGRLLKIVENQEYQFAKLLDKEREKKTRRL